MGQDLPAQHEFIEIVDQFWEHDAMPALMRYIAEPARSPLFDPDWESSGSLRQATVQIAEWCEQQQGELDLKVEVLEISGKTPTIFVEIRGSSPSSGATPVLIYGHYDKQPEFEGWSSDLGPYAPTRKNDKLFGRGSADDGYAIFAAIGAALSLQRSGAPYPNISILLEGSEESGSIDLADYLDLLSDRIDPELVITLDSSCPSYDRLWVSTSVRGAVIGTLRVTVLSEGIHSGKAGGIVPSSFRILRQLLARLENDETGELCEAFHVETPAHRINELASIAQEFGDQLFVNLPTIPGLITEGKDPFDRLIRNTWKPSFEVIGLGGAPSPVDAGNVLRPFTEVKFCLRLPPTANAAECAEALTSLWTENPPSNSGVLVDLDTIAYGWHSPTAARWLTETVDQASRRFYGHGAGYAGEGGSIPFLSDLGKRYPKAQVLALGLLGPNSNAHGPDECLDIPMAKNMTATMADVLFAVASQNPE